jgi:hypothetical protein
MRFLFGSYQRPLYHAAGDITPKRLAAKLTVMIGEPTSSFWIVLPSVERGDL